MFLHLTPAPSQLLIRLFLAISLCTGVTSCVSIIDATTDGPIEPDYGERTWGTYIDDKRIETTVAVNIRKASPELRAARVDVVSFNGVVLLIGQVNTPEDREAAARIAHAVQDVRQVHNELIISGSISLIARSNDSWLTTKIKTKLAFNDQVDAGRIKVVTEAGIVFLLGLVTHAEADVAVEIARNTRGVQKIVRVFEYIEQP